ncbi:MAG: pantoate--beta-alanine ligase [Bacteroidota bacterium]
MFIFQRVADLQAFLNQARQAGRSIGFVPTMGALHEGHLDLIRRAKAETDVAVASIFVNPTQFNDPKDLEKYPRTPEKDVAALMSAHCDVLLMPSVQEIYPTGQDISLEMDFGSLAKVMEGVFRPGHFDGMATVVKRLLDIVGPDRLFMGQKDFQQLSIVREMLRRLQMPVQLVMCDTKREPDGLAMSSRNMRLTPEMRAAAPVIYKTLSEAKEAFAQQPVADIEAWAFKQLEHAGLRPEYFDIVDGITLQPVTERRADAFVVACVAAFAGDVRLIDNLVLQEG